MHRFGLEWAVKLHDQEAARATIGHAMAVHRFELSPRLSISICVVDTVLRGKRWQSKAIIPQLCFPAISPQSQPCPSFPCSRTHTDWRSLILNRIHTVAGTADDSEVPTELNF
jgi:hypothetical protein